MVAQEQAIKTNNIKAKIDKTQENSKCRMCGKTEESLNLVLSEWSKLAQKEYKRRHDQFGTKIHREACRRHGRKVKEKRYKHKAEVVMENDECKILWDFTVQTDHEIHGRRPDVIAVQKDKNICLQIFLALMMDELEKIKHYQYLAQELRKIWNMEVLTTSDRYPRNNTHKVKQMVKGNRY